VSDLEYFATLSAFAAGIALLVFLIWTRHVWYREMKKAKRRLELKLRTFRNKRQDQAYSINSDHSHLYGEHLGRNDRHIR
jgi:hypothetical protein